MNPTNPFAVDSFRQRSVGLAAERVVDRCIIRQGLLGLDWPSPAERVYAKIVRTDAPGPLMSLGALEVQKNVSLPNTTSVLQVATGNINDFVAGRFTSSTASRLAADQ